MFCLPIYVSFLLISICLNLFLIHQNHLFLLFLALFLKKLKTHLFSFHFLHSLSSPRLPLDWYLRYWPSLVNSSHTLIVILDLHFIHAYFLLKFELQVSKNKLTLICSTFTGTINRLHFILLFVFTSCRNISYFSLSSNFVYRAER